MFVCNDKIVPIVCPSQKIELMIKKQLYIILSALVVFVACTTKPKQHSLQQDTVEEQPDTIKSDYPITDRLYAELDSSEIYDDSILYGYWFKPHEASAVNIFFHKNGSFEFKYYILANDSTIVDVFKKGTFTIGDVLNASNKKRIITMVADDGWDSKVFNGIIEYKRNRTHYYLTDKNSGLYLVKGSD